MTKSAMKFAGFSIGGIDWLEADLAGTSTAEERWGRLREIGHEEARLTHSMGGNLLRLFYSNGTLLSRSISVPTGGDALPHGPTDLMARLQQDPFYMLSVEDKVRYLDHLEPALRSQLDTVEQTNEFGDGLNFEDIDAYLEGVHAFNSALVGDSGAVKVLLTRVQAPPRPLVECPDHATLAAYGKSWTFESLFQLYNAIHAGIGRRVAARYFTGKQYGKVICGHEINNEPDYEWLPDELRIEHARKKDASPVGKYVTELHNGSIPLFSDPNPGHEPAPWGSFVDQAGAWRDYFSPVVVPISQFDFGAKFRWYVRCYAEAARHVSYAFWSVLKGSEVEVVSAGVTHNNIHYLIEMYRQDPEAFDYCTVIGLHPYHWPRHDIYDAEFWSKTDYGQWWTASPREFALNYFKHFDFFREVYKLTQKFGPDSYGLAGKKLWLTEFGIPTKLKGLYNSDYSEFVPFIRPKNMSEHALPHNSAVWEDLWNGFFDGVSPEKLSEYGVDMIAFYTLRETSVPGFDKHDDDRSNFSLVRRNGKPRLEAQTLDRFQTFMSKARKTQHSGTTKYGQTPFWGRSKTFSGSLLRSSPWLAMPLPEAVKNCLSMMTDDEKKLLYWATAEYYANAGEIVDAGAFVGGSAVSLAAGLSETWPETQRKIRSYDMFMADDFMQDSYFKPNGLITEGARFRNIYDANTRLFSGEIDVHDGDITTFNWDRGPIEILFIDVCKAWFIDDHVVKTFFPHLIPGQSLVLQQDFFHHYCPWLIATMELLHEHFEYVGFAKWNTGVFRCISPVDFSKRPATLRGLPYEKLADLLRSHRERYSDHYQKGILACAEIVLARDFGREDEMQRIGLATKEAYGEHPEVAIALWQLGFR